MINRFAQLKTRERIFLFLPVLLLGPSESLLFPADPACSAWSFSVSPWSRSDSPWWMDDGSELKP